MATQVSIRARYISIKNVARFRFIIAYDGRIKWHRRKNAKLISQSGQVALVAQRVITLFINARLYFTRAGYTTP